MGRVDRARREPQTRAAIPEPEPAVECRVGENHSASARQVSEFVRASYNQDMTRRLLLAVVGLTLGCNQAPTVPKIGPQPIELSMTFNTTNFQVGRRDTITVTATSLLDGTAQLLFDSDCQIVLTIRSTAGAAVVPPNGRQTCKPLATSLEIPALGSVSRTFVWSGNSQLIPPGGGNPLPAGSYFVSASIDATNYSTFAPAVRVELTVP